MKRLLCPISGMNAGGAETFLMKLYRRLDKTKYQMDFCVNISGRGFYDDEIERLGGRIYHIPCKSESLFRFRSELAGIVKDGHYDHVLKITSSGMGLMDLRIAKRAGAKVSAARSSNSSDGGGAAAELLNRLGRLLYGRYADVKLAPSDLAAIYTFGRRAYDNGEVTILHNALDTEQYRFDPAKRAAIRAELGIPEAAKVVGHVGRFAVQKNHAFLLDVFAELRRIEPESVLMLTGTGELEPQIREKAELLGLDGCVCFTGTRSDVPALMSAMDVFLLPSLYEGMPNAVIEAQASGLPCVIADTVTRQADITGLVEYLPLGSARQWAGAAQAAMRKERTDTSAAIARAGYDIAAVCRQFEQMIFGE